MRVSREVGFYTERFYAKTTVRLEFFNLLPPLLLNLFMTKSQVHRYDTRTASNYRVHSCHTNIKKFFTKDLESGTVFQPLLKFCQASLPLRTKC